MQPASNGNRQSAEQERRALIRKRKKTPSPNLLYLTDGPDHFTLNDTQIIVARPANEP